MSSVEDHRLRTRAAELYQLHAESLSKVFAGLDPSLTAQEREDLVQETFLRTFRRLAAFEGNSSISTYMYRIAQNLHVDHVRRAARRPRTMPIHVVDEDRNRSLGRMATRWEGALVDQLVAQDEAHEVLNALNDEERRLLALCLVADLPHKLVAELMDLTPQAVDTRLHRLKERVRALLRESRDERGL